MLRTLTMVMNECRNHFINSGEYGKFTIVNGTINTKKAFLKGQYILIKGSILNDGCYLFDDVMSLKNETFEGGVFGLVIPDEFIHLVGEIELFVEYSGSQTLSRLIKSESFSGYSYTLATTANGQVASWKDVFSSRLNAYRRMFDEEELLYLVH